MYLDTYGPYICYFIYAHHVFSARNLAQQHVLKYMHSQDFTFECVNFTSALKFKDYCQTLWISTIVFSKFLDIGKYFIKWVADN